MPSRRVVTVLAIASALVLLGARRESLAAGVAPPAWSRLGAPDACALVTTAEASKALEVTSLPGKPLIASSPKACMWSDNANAEISNRRLTVQYITVAGFQFVKSRASDKIKIEPVSGIGEEAFYQSVKNDSPMLNVRKGTTAIQVRILNGLKFKAFPLEQEKAKEAEIAKAAAARL